MLDGPVDGEMIEIGDPTEEPSAAEAAPQIVIQYHERGGVPWMLIPPLLLISAVGAVLLYAKLGPGRTDRHAAEVVDSLGEAPSMIPAPSTPWPEELLPPAPLEKRVEEAPTGSSTVVSPPTEPDVPPMIESSKNLAPASPPRIEGFGFDPKALEAERKGEPLTDPSLAPANRDDPPVEPEKPREVDPDLLPPDPREARARQQQRRIDNLKKVEEERTQFHTELKAICRKFREDSGPELLEMNKRYDIRVEPQAEKRALLLLGKTGQFAGADRRARVEVLRSLGYPEPVILSDLFDHYEKRLIGQRDGPRHPGEAYYLAALSLLRYPPTPAVKNNPTPRPNTRP